MKKLILPAFILFFIGTIAMAVYTTGGAKVKVRVNEQKVWCQSHGGQYFPGKFGASDCKFPPRPIKKQIYEKSI